MTPKFSKADAYRTDKPVVSLCNSYEGQYIVMNMEKIGKYEARDYWNCFDIYEANGVRIFYGNGVPASDNYNTEILKDCAKKLKDLNGWEKETVQKRQEIVKVFTDSVLAGIKNPSPIKNWSQFKKNLVQQFDFFPEKSVIDIAKNLTDKWIVPEAKDEINSKLQSAILENQRDCAGFYQNVKTDKEKMETTLTLIYRQEKDRQILRNQKKLEKSYEIER